MNHILTTAAGRAALLTAAALLLAGAVPARAATEPARSADWLLLTVTRDAAPTGIRPGTPRATGPAPPAVPCSGATRPAATPGPSGPARNWTRHTAASPTSRRARPCAR